MDFGIWYVLEQKACSVTHTSVTTLKVKLKKYWAEIDSETVRATCDQVIPHLRQVIKEKGGYIEKLCQYINTFSALGRSETSLEKMHRVRSDVRERLCNSCNAFGAKNVLKRLFSKRHWSSA